MEIPIINVNKSQIDNLLKQAISGAIQPLQRYITISSGKKTPQKKKQPTKNKSTKKQQATKLNPIKQTRAKSKQSDKSYIEKVTKTSKNSTSAKTKSTDERRPQHVHKTLRLLGK